MINSLKKKIVVTLALSTVLSFGAAILSNNISVASADHATGQVNAKHCKTRAEAQEAYQGGFHILWDVPNPKHECPICGRIGKLKGKRRM